jgi:NAD(P)-dependent dehydrogenase (short-subunit alcohol dehydrogenase family)
VVGRRRLGRGGEAVRAGELTRALLTGGTGKLGAAVAARLRGEGWQVLAAGSRDGDLARADDAHSLVARAADELGGLDVVVNGASAGFEPRRFEEVSEADVDAALGATVKGSFFVTQAATVHLRESQGLVIMVEDVAAYQPWPSFAAHCAAKAAQAMLTRTLAKALAPEVRVCGIAPGPVALEPGDDVERRAAETVLGRVGSPDDVADAILYLAGARFVTGATIVVDGGRLLQTGATGHA